MMLWPQQHIAGGAVSFRAASAPAPDLRQAHAAVWTGTEMIVWGGHIAEHEYRDGARYRP